MHNDNGSWIDEELGMHQTQNGFEILVLNIGFEAVLVVLGIDFDTVSLVLVLVLKKFWF